MDDKYCFLGLNDTKKEDKEMSKYQTEMLERIEEIEEEAKLEAAISEREFIEKYYSHDAN